MTAVCVCGHPVEEHDSRRGCLVGWKWNPSRMATVEGCDCELTDDPRAEPDDD